jgi:hypothetical protein
MDETTEYSHYIVLKSDECDAWVVMSADKVVGYFSTKESAEEVKLILTRRLFCNSEMINL